MSTLDLHDSAHIDELFVLLGDSFRSGSCPDPALLYQMVAQELAARLPAQRTHFPILSAWLATPDPTVACEPQGMVSPTMMVGIGIAAVAVIGIGYLLLRKK